MCVVWIGAGDTATAGFGGGGSWGCEGGVEGVGFERGSGGVQGDGGGGGRERVACYEDVLVGSAAAFGGYYVGVVRWCYFVDYADETFVPVGFVVVFWGCGRVCFFWIYGGWRIGGGGGGRDAFFGSVSGICETGFEVG